MVRCLYSAAACLLVGGTCFAASTSKSFETSVKPFLKANCVGCHNAKIQSGDLNLAQFLLLDAGHALQDRNRWERVLEKLRTGQMPPKGVTPPPAPQIQSVAAWIEAEYGRIDRAAPPDPGRVTARRLNRYEYNNTIRDLVGVSFRPADDFPADDSGYGFDNIGDVLSLSPILMEKYLKAAEKIANAAIVVNEPPLKPTVDRYSAERMNQMERLHLTAEHDFPVDGEYIIRSGWGNRIQVGLPMKAKLLLDGALLGAFDTSFEETRPRAFEGRYFVHAGPHKLESDLDVGDYQAEKGKMPFLEYIDVRGPFNQAPPTPSETHKRIFVCGHAFGKHEPGCARRIIAPLARRAYRRPVTDDEIGGLVRFVTMAQERGDSFEQGVRLALEAMLVSPHFLFRVERDPASGASAHTIGEYELASRLSYFLWSSMPDEELLALAGKGRLRAPGVLDTQVRRMLANPKSRALVENFGGQWLQTRNLDVLKPDPEKFPQFDAELSAAMRRETEMFFLAIIREDRSILDFIDGRFTYLNERLAKHYGIEDVKGPEFRRYTLDGVERSGVLTQASVLTVSSYPTRTSPVIRGKWLLDNILNAPPPPPPADVPNLDEQAVGNSGTLRQQLEAHRSKATCASCHARMDPLGFGLENYDAIGRWRTREGKFPLDVTGTLPGGKSFSTPAELKAVLKTDKDAFTRCLAEKLLTYGLGRGLERYDRPAVDSISRRVAEDGYRFSRLIEEIVNSLPFEMRRSARGVTVAARN